MLGRRPDGAALGGHGPARPAHACTCIRRLLPHRDHGDDPCEAHCPAKVTSARALAFPVPNRFQPAFSLNHPVNKYSGPSDERGTSLFRTAEPGPGGGRVRCLCGGVVRGVLCVAAGPAESASWAVFPAAVHRLLRGSVVGAGDCVAGRGFAEPAGFPGSGRDRGAAEPLDAVAHAASDRRETHVAVVRQANWRRMAGESPAEGRSNQPPSPRVMRRSL